MFQCLASRAAVDHVSKTICTNVEDFPAETTKCSRGHATLELNTSRISAISTAVKIRCKLWGIDKLYASDNDRSG